MPPQAGPSRRRDPLVGWYARHGRHDLPWRATRDRWAVLVSEVMLVQTQVPRVIDAWTAFMDRFPDPATAAGAGPGALIAQWQRLGYPRRARWLWEAAVIVHQAGWPPDARRLPGVGPYIAEALAAQVDDADAVGIDTNIRRVCERTAGRALGDAAAADQARTLAPGLGGRDRFLALMDVGAVVCTARAPRCGECPLHAGCTTRGVRDGETRRRQARYEGSLRQRRGAVLARLRDEGRVPAYELDAEALAGLQRDGLVEIHRGAARLARR